MLHRKEALNSRSTLTLNENKYARCWYCKLNGYDILDKFGCCKRCGTNLKKYPYWKKKSELNTEQIAQEVLGIRQGFVLPKDNEQGNW